jgi:NAD(P)-dependent dehydrogenase (short-subunit alcohol dehydrogenase family)
MGARLVIVARSRRRGENALARLAAHGPGIAHSIHYADLSRLTEMKRVGAEIAAAEPRIDVLINNAGCVFGRREVTEDGLERTFALNHVAYFVLTQLLRDRLVAAAPARIVNTASDAHLREELDFGDLQFAKGYRFRAAYGRSKLANILFTRELARRLDGTGVTANALHPGTVRTGFTGGGDTSLLNLGWRLGGIFFKSPQKGAETSIYLASSYDVEATSGEYFVKKQRAKPAASALTSSA